MRLRTIHLSPFSSGGSLGIAVNHVAYHTPRAPAAVANIKEHRSLGEVRSKGVGARKVPPLVGLTRDKCQADYADRQSD